MQISIPCCNSLVEIVDNNINYTTTLYDSAERRTFNVGDELHDIGDFYIYEYSGTDSFYAPDWTQIDENNEVYSVGDVLFKDSNHVVVSSTGAYDDHQQPEDYAPSLDNSWLYDQWQYRYTKLLTGVTLPFSGFQTTIGDTVHTLYKSIISSTGWTYRINWEENIDTWTDPLYKTLLTEKTMITYDSSEYYYVIWWNGASVGGGYLSSFPSGTVVHGTDGFQYKNVSAIAVSGPTVFYSVSRLEPKAYAYVETTDPIVATEADINVYEEQAYSIGDPTREKWLGRHFIIRGTDVYMRTHLNNEANWAVVVQIADNVYTTIDTLDKFPNFSNVGVVDYRKPFDGKKYTAVQQLATDTDPVSWVLKSTGERFDTFAMAGVIANDIELVFRLPPVAPATEGEIVSHIQSYEPLTSRDINNVLSPYQTTAVLYSTASEPMSAESTVEVIFKGGDVRVATILLGLNVNAGMTNANFTTKFIDRSPKEVDQWGNVIYVTTDSTGATVDVKQLTWTGTVDIPITNFDMTTRLMTSMGARTLIINGSDATDNSQPNNLSTFASTMLIGRLKDFNLKTNLRNKKIDDTAVYSITIEEDV